MKTAIHPEYMKTTVHCNSCNTTFESRSTVPEITVEICSNCHPFYTGKQKLVDTAGRVDRFRARQAAATAKVAKVAKAQNEAEDPKLAEIQAELEQETVEVEAPQVDAAETQTTETPAEAPAADESTDAPAEQSETTES